MMAAPPSARQRWWLATLTQRELERVTPRIGSRNLARHASDTALLLYLPEPATGKQADELIKALLLRQSGLRRYAATHPSWSWPLYRKMRAASIAKRPKWEWCEREAWLAYVRKLAEATEAN